MRRRKNAAHITTHCFRGGRGCERENSACMKRGLSGRPAAPPNKLQPALSLLYKWDGWMAVRVNKIYIYGAAGVGWLGWPASAR